MIAVPKKEFILPRYLAQYTNSPYGTWDCEKESTWCCSRPFECERIRQPTYFPAGPPRTISFTWENQSRMSVCDSIRQTIDASLQQAEALHQKHFETSLWREPIKSPNRYKPLSLPPGQHQSNRIRSILPWNIEGLCRKEGLQDFEIKHNQKVKRMTPIRLMLTVEYRSLAATTK